MRKFLFHLANLIALIATFIALQFTYADSCDVEFFRPHPLTIGNKNPHPAITISQFLQQMKESGQLDKMMPVLEGRLRTALANPALVEPTMAQLKYFVASGDFNKLNHWPVFSMQELGSIHNMLPKKENAASTSNSQKITTTLSEFLSLPAKVAEPPAPLDPQIPQITYGYFANANVDTQTIDQSIKLTQILESLSAQNDSSLQVADQIAKDPESFFKSLIDSGHTITLQDQRTYADFMSFNFGDNEIIWPLWIDTGVKLKNGKALIVPMGHSQLVYQVQGPLIKNAYTSFFLGVNGVGFFANVYMRPNWTGLRAIATVSSQNGNAKQILTSIKAATTYKNRILTEANTLARNMSAQGYGYLGVCNDSVGVIDALLGMPPESLPYPLLRQSSVNQKSTVTDALTPILSTLPKDTENTNADPQKVIQRVLYMFPFDTPQEASALGADFVELMKAAKSQ